MDTPAQRAVYRLRPGALDAVARTRGISTATGLADALGISTEELDLVRNGHLVGFPMAVRVAELTGSGDDLSAWTELVG
ncbi:hypothetical protein [Corynebacterium terpenotabidum]|uniref:HTH cro/C1-type domain-containing protein n=1 Tax=Corynebacterium terpenotabidum Y-11 TaxID=1200352 RepID=S4XCE7_9CORY|nr:hypothetical protein [Corynebacterium terpenotabidum]AGP30797.1 hypothetical protein A606_05750 [Corynebacterium terpenotabidum Y-11]